MLSSTTPTLSLLSSYTFHSVRSNFRKFPVRPLSGNAPVDDTPVSPPELLDNSWIQQSDAKFRLQSQNIGLTYSQIGEGWTAELILSQLKTAVSSLKRIAIKSYIVSLEKHKDGGNHSHIVLSLSAKPNIRNSRFFDLTAPSGKICHPEIEPIGKSLAAKVIYAAKDGNYISEGFNIVALQKKTLSKKTDAQFVDDLLDLVKRQGIRAGTKYLKEYAPPSILRSLSRVRKQMKDYDEFLKSDESGASADFSISDFDSEAVQKLIDFIKIKPAKVTLYMNGPSGTGKSSMLQAVLEAHHVKYLFVRSLDCFKGKDLSDYDLIVFDDFPFGEILKGTSKPRARERLLQVFDPLNKGVITKRYEDAIIPKGMPRIVVGNPTKKDFLRSLGVENDQAFLSRILDFPIPKDIRIVANANTVNILQIVNVQSNPNNNS